MVATLNELIDSLDAHRVSIREAMEPETGYRRVGAGNSAQREANELRFLQLLAEVKSGRKPVWYLQETQSRSDFPLLLGGTLERVLLGGFQAWPTIHQNFFRMSTVRDFREAKRFTVDGGESQLEQVAENAPYPESSLTEDEAGIRVYKHGRIMGFSFEAMINDDLNAFTDIPLRFGRAAARTRAKAATQVYTGTTGLDGTLFDASNTVTSNPALSIAALGTAMTILGAQVDEEGEPIMTEMVHLVVPPALEVTARNILNSMEIWLNEAGGTSDQQMHVVNWMRNRMQLHIDPYLPIVASSSNGNTTWFLFADASVGRPAAEFATLVGHEQPEIFMKSNDAVRVGGGDAGENAGDFEHDAAARYKVRDIFGTRRGAKTGVVGSNGSGS